MKKILFTILAAAAMSAACTKFAEDVIPDYDTVAKPLVEANVCDDDSVTVVVTAGENTSYYGYAVVEGVIEGVTAEKLVANGYAKNSAVVLQGEEKTPQAARIRFSEETASVTLNLTGLTPYTDYTVYAAAVSPMGVPSEVVAVTVKTTDGTEPLVNVKSAGAEEADSVLTFVIPFSDPVTLTGTGTAKAYFYGENYTDENGYLIVCKEVEIPADHMATDGKYLLLAVPADEYIPGAMVSMTYSADIVVNGAGAKNAAFEDHLMAWMKGELAWNGIVGQYEYVNWDFSLVDPATLPDEPAKGEGEMEEEEEEEKEPVYFNDWTKLMMIGYVVSDYPLAGKTGEGGVEVSTSEASGKTVSYPAKTYGVAGDFLVGVMLNEKPAYGSSVSYTIAEGTFCDIFGNVNNEFVVEDGYFHSYGYTLDDIVGSYEYATFSAYDGSPVAGTWTIAASDKPEKGNVMFTEMYSTPCVRNVYATFDMVSGTLTVPSLQLYGESDKYLFAFCSSDNSGKASDIDVVFAVQQAGVINGQSCYFGNAAVDPTSYDILGFFDIYVDFEAVRTQVAPAAAPVREAARVSF